MPPAPRSEELLRKRKDARQKKLLFVLVPVLVIAVAIQGPRLAKQLSSAKEKTEEVQDQVVEGYEELAPEGEPPSEAPDGGAPGNPTASLAVADGLPDTDPPPVGGEDKLISFTRFSARDPFVQLVDDGEGEASEEEAATDSGAGASGGGSSVSIDDGSSAEPAETTTGPADDGGETAAGQASISVNGTVVVVEVGGTFPADDPAFQLVAIEGELVKIGLAAGSFSSGVETLDLKVGDTVTLISQPDGARFQIEIVRIGA